jgi:hypothetical protein
MRTPFEKFDAQVYAFCAALNIVGARFVATARQKKRPPQGWPSVAVARRD